MACPHVPSAEVIDSSRTASPWPVQQATQGHALPSWRASGAEESYVAVDSARMYFLVDNHEFGEHELELRCSPGVAAFAFTFTSCVDPVASALQATALHGS